MLVELTLAFVCMNALMYTDVGVADVIENFDRLYEMLAEAHGLVEINNRLRADGALQAAFGRSR